MVLPPQICTENCTLGQASVSARRYSARLQVDASTHDRKGLFKSIGGGFQGRHEGRVCHTLTERNRVPSEFDEGRCGQPGNAEPPELIAFKLF